MGWYSLWFHHFDDPLHRFTPTSTSSITSTSIRFMNLLSEPAPSSSSPPFHLLTFQLLLLRLLSLLVRPLKLTPPAPAPHPSPSAPPGFKPDDIFFFSSFLILVEPLTLLTICLTNMIISIQSALDQLSATSASESTSFQQLAANRSSPTSNVWKISLGHLFLYFSNRLHCQILSPLAFVVPGLFDDAKGEIFG